MVTPPGPHSLWQDTGQADEADDGRGSITSAFLEISWKIHEDATLLSSVHGISGKYRDMRYTDPQPRTASRGPIMPYDSSSPLS